MFSTERQDLRNIFFESWRKHCEQLAPEPLEAQIIAVMLEHPEYHAILNQPHCYEEKEFLDSNPFLHMGLHLAVQEQINTNRPNGINTIFAELQKQANDTHTAEHKMIDCLGLLLWDAQRKGAMPDEQHYLTCLQQLL